MSDQIQFDDILAPKELAKKKGEGNLDNEDLENESIEEIHQIENDQQNNKEMQMLKMKFN